MSYTYLLTDIFNPATFQGALFYAVCFLLVAWAVGQLIHFLVCRYVARTAQTGADSTSVQFLAQLARAIVYILAILSYTHVVPALQSLGTAWLASVGIVSVVVGLAAQSTLGNLIAGISLVLYRPFRIGDRIQITAPTGTEIGTVEGVDLGYTTLRTADGRRLVLSNSIIANQTSINFSRSLPHMPCDVVVTISPESSIADARKILLDVANKISKIHKINGCFVTSLGATGTVLTLSMVCGDPDDVMHVKSDVLEGASKKFAAAGIKVS